MSGEKAELYHHDRQFFRDHTDLPFSEDLALFFSNNKPNGLIGNDFPVIDAPLFSFANYLHGSADYGFDLLSADVKRESEADIGSVVSNSLAGTGPATPNSSVSSFSSDEESGRCKKEVQKIEREEEREEKKEKGGEDEELDKAKKVLKPRKKGEKRLRVPRVAFMTKSEVDHLEDGYRWRKYGQKAVKNSPYPRSYYRCTTAKCLVKKRVERSYQDPSVVITTYEGQHTHQSPATLRGSGWGSHRNLSSAPPGLSHEFMMQQIISPMMNSNSTTTNHPILGAITNPNLYLPNLPLPLPPPPLLQPHQLMSSSTDHGLLQDLVPGPFVQSNQLP